MNQRGDVPGAGRGIWSSGCDDFRVRARASRRPLYNFGFSAFEAILSSAGTCTSPVTVTETQVFPFNIDNASQVSVLGPFPSGVTDAEPFYGEGGLNNVFTINDASCLPSANILMGAFLSLTNPRVIRCSTGTCITDPPVGAFPLGALIPGDPVGGGKEYHHRRVFT
jgi:hypothetical protein